MNDEEIRSYFENQELNEQQLQMIRDYIKEDETDENELSEDDLAYLQENEMLFAMAKEIDPTDYALYDKLKNGDR